MFKTFSAAAIAISLLAAPALAQGNAPVTQPVKTEQTVNPVTNKAAVHKTSVHKASLHRAHRHVAHVKKTNKHIAKHVKKVNKHVAKHVKPVKPAKTVKRIKQDKVNTAG